MLVILLIVEALVIIQSEQSCMVVLLIDLNCMQIVPITYFIVLNYYSCEILTNEDIYIYIYKLFH